MLTCEIQLQGNAPEHMVIQGQQDRQVVEKFSFIFLHTDGLFLKKKEKKRFYLFIHF